jgi:hypothetical protein
MTDVTAAAPTEAPAAPPEAGAETEDGRSARRKLLDHLLDSIEAGPQSRQQILESTGVDRNTMDQALFRAVEAEEIERVDRGLYKLAPPKPKLPRAAAAPPPPAEPERVREGHSDSEWFALIAAYHATGQWDRERDGLPPDQFGNRVPLDIIMRLNHRQEEAKKAAEKAAQKAAAQKPAASAKPAAAVVTTAEDLALLDRLVAAAHGNVVNGPGIMDLRPIYAALETVEIDDVLYALKSKVNLRIYPKNRTLTSWSEEWFLREVAERFVKRVLIPAMVARWSGTAPGKPTERAEPPAAVSAP